MNLAELNQQSEKDADLLFMQCCTSVQWVKKMTSARPYSDMSSLKDTADDIWKILEESDFLQAFEGHPKIGDVNSLRNKYSNTKKLASGEQGLVSEASEQVILDLSSGNEEYSKKFGFIFIVCATGKSAVEMLDLLQQRLPNNRNAELANASEEQRKIFQIRLNKLIEIK
ncbi:MAG: OHCU decarboxylase [Kangiella sp.]|nr:MAG: OHCU decarboxylase [Kangiella sp.]